MIWVTTASYYQCSTYNHCFQLFTVINIFIQNIIIIFIIKFLLFKTCSFRFLKMFCISLHHYYQYNDFFLICLCNGFISSLTIVVLIILNNIVSTTILVTTITITITIIINITIPTTITIRNTIVIENVLTIDLLRTRPLSKSTNV